MRRALLALSAAPAALLPFAACAETLVTDPVSVSATRLPTTEADAAVSVSVITQADLERAAYRTVADALESLPGVSLARTGAAGGTASVFVRGLKGDQLLVLIDGVPVNDPAATGGAFDFANLDAANIERIELLRGAQATLWGSGAMAGVVSITTKGAKEGLHFSGFAEYGSHASARAGGTASWGGEIGDLAVSYAQRSIGGFSSRDDDPDHDGDEGWALDVKGGINLPTDGRLTLALRKALSDSEFDNAFDPNQDHSVQRDERSATIGIEQPLLGGRALVSAQAGYAAIDRDYTRNEVFNYDYAGERRFARVQGTVEANGWNTLSFGTDYETISGKGTFLGTPDDQDIWGVFGVWESRPVEGLTLTGGLRHDEHSETGGHLTGRASAAYEVYAGLTLRAGYAEAFRAPTLNQLTYGFPAPNANLKPETSQEFEIGLDYADPQGRYAIGASLFRQEIEDEIDYFFNPVTFADGYFNIDKSRYTGLELTGSVKLGSMFVLSGNYTYLDARDVEADTGLIRRPRHKAEARLAFDDGGPVTAEIAATYSSGYPDFSGAVSDWVRFDASVAWRVDESVQVYLRAENLNDAEYEYVSGYNTPGRSAYVGLRAAF